MFIASNGGAATGAQGGSAASFEGTIYEGAAISPPPELLVESGSTEPKRVICKVQALANTQDHTDQPPAHSMFSATRRGSSASNMTRALCTATAIANYFIVQQQAATRQFPLQVFAKMVNAMLDQEMREQLEYRQ